MERIGSMNQENKLNLCLKPLLKKEAFLIHYSNPIFLQDQQVRKKLYLDKANLQPDWIKKGIQRRSPRKTFLEEIQHFHRKSNSPSPSQYNLEMVWPKKNQKQHQ